MILTHWLGDWRRHLVAAGAALAVAALTAANGRAQDASAADVAALKAQMAAQQRQIEELTRLVQSRGFQPAQAPADNNVKLDDDSVKRLVDGYLNEKEKEKKAQEEAVKKKEEAEGYKVGSALGMNVRWREDNSMSGLYASTTNNDYYLHLGGRFQMDTVWFTESPALKKSSFGDLQDGTFFRRLRIEMDGGAWEVLEFKIEYAMEQTLQGINTDDEIFAGIKDMPWIGTIRVGHMRVPQGLEGDLTSSSKSMTFLEKAAYTDAFYENFGTGIWTGNHVLNDHATWAAMAYRQDNGFGGNGNGADFGDGKYAYTARVTALPIYEDDGNCFLHLAASGTFRKAEDATPGLTGPGILRFRARPELRDAIGQFGGTTEGVPNPGNSSRLVDTGSIAADSATVIGTEFLLVRGPASVQAEWAAAGMNDATANGVKGNFWFNGGYVQASYFLTGEHRTYDRRLGRLGSMYFDGPTTPFWFVSKEDGSWSWGLGAWEVAARYSYLNLNDGPVQGGVLQGVELGLNWYLNRNLKVQFEYMDNNRYHEKGQPSGDVQGFGTRVQLYF